MTLDGWAAVRIGDLVRVRRAPHHRFADRLLTDSGQLPAHPPRPGLNLDTTRCLIEGAIEAAPTITIYSERRHPDECYIGCVNTQGRHLIVLQEIDPDAQWSSSRRYRRSAITRVDIGGPYEAALLEVGGPPPSPPGR